MKKAINLYFYGGDTKTKLDAIKSAGYDGVLLGMYTDTETMSITEQLEYCKNINLEVSMIHCQYNPELLNNFWDKDNEIANEILNNFINQVESISGFGVKNFVVHLSGTTTPKTSIYGLERIKKLLDVCQKNNIRLCVENLEYPKHVDYIFKNINHPMLYFCYDSGHKNCFSKYSKIAKKYSKILSATHIHDNFGSHDDHIILGLGKTNLNELASELSQSNCEFLSAEIKYKNSSMPMYEILKLNLEKLNILDEKIKQKRTLKI